MCSSCDNQQSATENVILVGALGLAVTALGFVGASIASAFGPNQQKPDAASSEAQSNAFPSGEAR
jgi:hypothetical protein